MLAVLRLVKCQPKRPNRLIGWGGEDGRGGESKPAHVEWEVGDGEGCGWDGACVQKLGEASCDRSTVVLGECGCFFWR